MRWDGMRVNGATEPTAAPALFERGAIARTFDTPGFRGMTFHEVHAKTIISKVPEVSRMPFKWTINPYRGCGHACVYCLAGDTPLLMADGRTKPISEVRAGDSLYGTERRGRYRRYVTTTVLAHWQTVKPAYRVSLEDGTRLITSGDHRFLTDRGWKHVTGKGYGEGCRPHLTTKNELLGVGAFAESPKESAEYRRGYLCGTIRGDANLGEYTYPRGASDGEHVYRFRLALADREALARAAGYLAQEGVATTEFEFSAACETRRGMRAIRTSTRAHYLAVQDLIRWPKVPTLDWQKGFLAGIFDAEGSCSGGILRISNTDPSIIEHTTSCMRALLFDAVVEPVRHANGLAVVRLRGGLRERLRFFHSTDPAITRKRSIDGVAIKSDAKLKVEQIEAVGFEMPMFDITTGTGDFIADGVVSHNCFARNTHTYLDMDAGHDFDTQIVVKVNAPERLQQELASPRWCGEHIAMGTNVDCYQRAEGKYRLMPGIIGALSKAANPFSILTKGTLILRDIDLLAEAAEVTDVGLNVSVGFTDRELSRLAEPGTPVPERRLEACAALNERGLRCGVLMGPVLPFLSDSPAQLDRTVREIAATGATHVSPIVLHLRPGAREWFLRWLQQAHPELMDAYAELYGRRAYAPATYQRAIADQVAELARKHGVGRANPAAARRVQRQAPGHARRVGKQSGPPDRHGEAAAADAPVQLSLL